MPEKQPCCPNCDTVLRRQYQPGEPERMWYECDLCGYRIPAGLESAEAGEASQRRPRRAA